MAVLGVALIIGFIILGWLAYMIQFHTGTMYSKDKYTVVENDKYYIIRGKNWAPLEGEIKEIKNWKDIFWRPIN